MGRLKRIKNEYVLFIKKGLEVNDLSGLTSFFRLFKSKYVLIYTAIGDDDCMKVIGKLRGKRIPYKTKVPGLLAGGNRRDFGFDSKLSQYKIYVKREFEHEGRAAIYH